MKSSTEFFDHVVLRNMTAALDAVVAQWAPELAGVPDFRTVLARHIVAAASSGEHDTQQLVHATSRLLMEGRSSTRFPQAHRSSP